MKLNPDMMPVLIAAVSAGGDNAAETSKVIEEEVIPEVESVEGVASVAASGSIENTVEITVNEQKVTELNDDIKAELEKKINEAKSALDDAKAQVESGKAALAAGTSQASQGLAQAESRYLQKARRLSRPSWRSRKKWRSLM